jgi:hypothetical protein
MRPLLTVIPALLLLVSACSKGMDYERADAADMGHGNSFYSLPGDRTASQAVGTVKTRDGVRFIQLDPVSTGFVVNPKEIEDLADGTRVYLQYRTVVSPDTPDFCTDAILVEWATPLEQGALSLISFEEQFSADSFLSTDPVDIVPDWITSLEDDFLTLHYTIASGDKKHSFVLFRSMTEPAGFYLVHDADGDTGKALKDGIIFFPLSMENLFPDVREGETAALSLHYLNLDHTLKTLTFEYRSPK